MTGRARASRGGCRGERAAAIAATPRSARLRDDGRAPPSQPPPPVTLLRSDRPGSYLAPRPVSTTNSQSWWTDKRGPVTTAVPVGILAAGAPTVTASLGRDFTADIASNTTVSRKPTKIGRRLDAANKRTLVVGRCWLVLPLGTLGAMSISSHR